MLANSSWERNPVAFIDDNPAKRAQRILGVAVRGSIEDLETVLQRVRIEEVVLSSPAIAEGVEARVRELCDAHGVPVRRLHMDIL